MFGFYRVCLFFAKKKANFELFFCCCCCWHRSLFHRGVKQSKRNECGFIRSGHRNVDRFISGSRDRRLIPPPPLDQSSRNTHTIKKKGQKEKKEAPPSNRTVGLSPRSLLLRVVRLICAPIGCSGHRRSIRDWPNRSIGNGFRLFFFCLFFLPRRLEKKGRRIQNKKKRTN